MERYLNIKRLPIDCVVEEAPENEPKPAFGVAHKATCQVKANPGQEYFIMLDDIKTKKENLRNYAYENVPQTRIDTGKAFANLMDNYHGDQVKVILATKENFKGVDMNHLRYLHLVDPLVDFQDFIQFMGRGPRFCSHRKYTIAKRNVELMLYRVVAGDNCPKNERARALLADCHVFDNSLRRYEYNWAIIEKALQEASVDYLVFRDNIHRNNEIIQQRIMDLKCAVVESAKELIPKMGKEFVEEHRARRDAEMAEEKAKADELKRQQQELFGRQRIGRAERAAMRDARRQ
jgi:hypothetical protein